MGKDSPAMPASPDYQGAAVAQGAANKEAAVASSMLGNPSYDGPYGGRAVNYAIDPATGNLKSAITDYLNPQSQRIFDTQQDVKLGLAGLGQQGVGTASNVLSTPFSTSNLPQAPINAGTTAQAAIMSRLQPQLQQRRAMQETALRNQGLVPGGEAYGASMRDLGNAENDALIQAGAQGISMDQNARAQALQEQLGLRSQPLNEITALMSGTQIQNPQFQQFQGANIAPANYAGAAQNQAQYGQGLYNAQVGAQNAQTSGLFGLGAAGLGAYGTYAGLAAMSDRRLKSNIVQIGLHPVGVPLYEFDIFGERRRGVMADELQEIRPDAVHRHPSGYLMVDYGAIFHA